MATVEITGVEKDSLITEQSMEILNLTLSLKAYVRVVRELEAELEVATKSEKSDD